MDADENAVVEKFQWGTGGLHGCSMLTIASKRGVRMVRPYSFLCGYLSYTDKSIGALLGEPSV
jgi:hypothetical protein